MNGGVSHTCAIDRMTLDGLATVMALLDPESHAEAAGRIGKAVVVGPVVTVGRVGSGLVESLARNTAGRVRRREPAPRYEEDGRSSEGATEADHLGEQPHPGYGQGLGDSEATATNSGSTEDDGDNESEDVGAAQGRLQKKFEMYRQLPSEELRRRVIQRLGEVAGSRSDPPDQLGMLRRAAEESGFKPGPAMSEQDMAYLVVTRQLAALRQDTEVQLANATPEQRHAILQNLDAQIAAMDAPHLERLKVLLGIDHLDSQELIRVVLSGGAATAFATGVGASGFAAYLALTTVMNAVATTLLGVTLPFAAYAAATTALSYASGGLLIAPVLASWAFFHSRKRGKETRAMLPYVVTLILLLRPNRSALPGWTEHRVPYPDHHGVWMGSAAQDETIPRRHS